MPFILDSGAFSVWNRGETIDLDQYIQFCVDHADCSYFVNLDIIPGKPNDVKSKTPSLIESACQGGWDNYQRMIKRLPLEKVVPVFHQGDSYDWLEKYLDFGTPYLGISPANDRTTEQKMTWLAEVKKYIFDSAGRPIVKTHGFAVTAFRLMKFMQWHSVDSASWVRSAAYGTVYVPMQRKGEWRYDIEPFMLNVSPKSPTRDERQKHLTSLSPTVSAIVEKYLTEMRMPVGSYEVVQVPEGHKKGENELWFEKGKKDKVVRTTKKGVMTCHQRRFYLNWQFLKNANDVLPVDHIYFAGAGGSLRDEIEYRLGNRLMAYPEISQCKKAGEVFRRHMEILKDALV